MNAEKEKAINDAFLSFSSRQEGLATSACYKVHCADEDDKEWMIYKSVHEAYLEGFCRGLDYRMRKQFWRGVLVSSIGIALFTLIVSWLFN